jgi:sulfur-oxidizing protein SoxY
MTLNRRLLLSTLGTALISPLSGRAGAAADQDPWPDLVANVFDGRPMEPGAGIVDLELPSRALDASLTPLTLNLHSQGSDALTRITIVIDRNPAPVAAVIRLGDKAEVSRIETRVRVNENTFVHAVAESASGRLFMVEKFIKAAGGCSAPSMKDAAEASASLGRMKLRQFSAPASLSAPREVQLMIRHPNNSGFQVDQITHYYIPARFIDQAELKQDGELIIAVEGGISISEDPIFRVTFRYNGASRFSARIHDTDGASFAAEWDAIPPGSQGT